MPQLGRRLLAAAFLLHVLMFVLASRRIGVFAFTPWMPASRAPLLALGSFGLSGTIGLGILVALGATAVCFALVVFVGSAVFLLRPREPRPFLGFAAASIAAYALLVDAPGYLPHLAITRTSNPTGFLLELAGGCLIASGRRQRLGTWLFGMAYACNAAHALYVRLAHAAQFRDASASWAWALLSALGVVAGICLAIGLNRRLCAIVIAAVAAGTAVYVVELAGGYHYEPVLIDSSVAIAAAVAGSALLASGVAAPQDGVS